MPETRRKVPPLGDAQLLFDPFGSTFVYVGLDRAGFISDCYDIVRTFSLLRIQMEGLSFLFGDFPKLPDQLVSVHLHLRC